MKEWLLSLETGPGAAAGDETLEMIHEALDGDAVAHAPVVGFHGQLPIITARFEVQAESTDEAKDLALAAFERALAAAGVTATCKVSAVEPA